MENNVKIKDDTQSLQSCVSVSVMDRDFRIGNLINYRIIDKIDERQEWLEVSEIDHDDLRIFGIKDKMNNDYQPIPLTEEWLMKFGIGKQNSYPYKYLTGYLKIRNGIYFFKYYDLEVELPFVHSLQNLHYVLKGSELQIDNLTEH